MKCPFCSYRDSRVVDSRAVDDGVSAQMLNTIKR